MSKEKNLHGKKRRNGFKWIKAGGKTK